MIRLKAVDNIALQYIIRCLTCLMGLQFVFLVSFCTCKSQLMQVEMPYHEGCVVFARENTFDNYIFGNLVGCLFDASD